MEAQIHGPGEGFCGASACVVTNRILKPAASLTPSDVAGRDSHHPLLALTTDDKPEVQVTCNNTAHRNSINSSNGNR